MGRLQRLLGVSGGPEATTGLPPTADGREMWRRAFGTSKEDRFPRVRHTPGAPGGGSWGRSSVSEGAAFRRLLQALRSMAPGGWSDDRWEQSRHLVGVAYVGIERVNRRLSQSAFQVFRKDPRHQDGKRPVSERDPPEGGRLVRPWDLVELLTRPNRQDTFGMWLWRIGQQKKLTGTALTWMVPNVLEVPHELYCIPTALAIPQPAVNPDYPDGFYRIQPVYPYGPWSSYPTPTSAVGAPIPAQWVLRMQYPHPLLRYEGYSPLTGMRLEMDEFEAIGRSRWYKMKRAFRPNVVLNMEHVEGAQPWDEFEIERIRTEFANEHEGPENNGRLLIPPPGGKFEEFGHSPEEMDFPNSWEQMADFILGGGFGISKPAAGMTETSNYATLWAAMKQLDTVTVQPECDDIAAELTYHLAPFFGDDLIVEIKAPKINDHELTQSVISAATSAKCITKNEVRKLLDLPLTDEEWGDDMAGDPSPAEKEQQQGAMGGMPGQPGAEQPGGAAGAGPEQPAPSVLEPGTYGEEPPEEEASGTEETPAPGPLGQGALGPRSKALKLARTPHRSRFRPSANGKVSVNGNGRH